MSKIIEDAIAFAAIKHHGQYHKSTNTPYITHPVGVGLILKEANYKVFLVGINPATANYPKQVNEDEFVEMLRDSIIFNEKYHTIRIWI